MNTTTYLGVIDGLNAWEVRNEAGEVVGYNQRGTFEEEVAIPTSEENI